MVPMYEKTLFYRGEPVATSKGMNLDYIYDMENGSALWIVQTGEKFIAENESVFEEYENSYLLADYTIVNEGKVLYEIENAYLVSHYNDTAFFLKGNYIYAVGSDGTEYIRALHNMMATD